MESYGILCYLIPVHSARAKRHKSSLLSTIIREEIIGNLPVIIVTFPVIGDLLNKSSGSNPAKTSTATLHFINSTLLHAICDALVRK